MGLGAWAALHESKFFILGVEFWAVFSVWQLLPIFVTGFGAQADLGILLRFPVSYPAFVLQTLSYGLLDPVAIAGLYWLGMILAGIGFASPSALPWAVAGLSAFAGVNLLLNRAVFAWLDRWLSQRRTREILGVVFFTLIISIQFIGPIGRRWGSQASSIIRHIAPVEALLPPGMAAKVIEGARPGGGLQGLVSLGGLAGLGLALAWALAIRLRAQFRGENLGEAPRAAAAAAVRDRLKDGSRRPALWEGWEIPGLSPAVQALLEKDLRYLLRNTGQYLLLAIPPLLVLLFSLQSGESHGPHGFSIAHSRFFLPLALAYCLLVLMRPAYNALGYDGAGISMLFAAPVRFHQVLFAKNLLSTLVFALEAATVFAVTLLVGGTFHPLIAAVSLAALLFALPVNFAAANLVSLHFPTLMQFGTMRRQKVSGISAIITLAVEAVTLGLCAGIIVVTGWFGMMWLASAVFLVLAIIALAVYRRVLTACSAIADRRRESLLQQLCR